MSPGSDQTSLGESTQTSKFAQQLFSLMLEIHALRPSESLSQKGLCCPEDQKQDQQPRTVPTSPQPHSYCYSNIFLLVFAREGPPTGKEDEAALGFLCGKTPSIGGDKLEGQMLPCSMPLS